MTNAIFRVREKFTRWYFKRGYTLDLGVDRIYYGCPWWVKPFVSLISPSLYNILFINNIVAEGFEEGLRRGRLEGIWIWGVEHAAEE